MQSSDNHCKLCTFEQDFAGNIDYTKTKKQKFYSE